MAESWSSGVLNKYVAPGLTEFTEAEIPDLRSEFEQASHWLANLFLNTALRATYQERFRQVALGFLRRVYHGFRAYHTARDQTLNYLSKAQPHNPSVTAYYNALEQWEVFALHVSMATDLFRWLNEGEGTFRKNDGSPEQRLYTIANQAKHLRVVSTPASAPKQIRSHCGSPTRD